MWGVGAEGQGGFWSRGASGAEEQGGFWSRGASGAGGLLEQRREFS